MFVWREFQRAAEKDPLSLSLRSKGCGAYTQADEPAASSWKTFRVDEAIMAGFSVPPAFSQDSVFCPQPIFLLLYEIHFQQEL